MAKNKKLSAQTTKDLLGILAKRFNDNMSRHSTLKWADVEARLSSNTSALWTINEMELSGGEPDVVADKKSAQIIFYDCAAESPKGRRSCCYDEDARESRKEHKPKISALGMAAEMGAEILTESEYRQLQDFGEFDLKTSSWVKTPENIRELGGAIFCDRRYNEIFTYHNGAESYYAARAFRVKVEV